MPKNSLLVMDDQPLICEFVADVATQLGYLVRACSDSGEFRRIYQEVRPDVIVLDLQMPGPDGVELLRWLAAAGSPSRILIMSGMDEKVLHTVRQLAVDYGLSIAGVLRKPARVAELQELLQNCMTRSAAITESELAEAIAADGLVVHYQPIFGLAGGKPKLESAEALVRLHRPEQKLLQPDAFIGLAESSGLIRELTDKVLEQVVRQISRWQLTGPAIPVAVNLSAVVLDDLDLPNRMSELLAAHHVEPAQVVLEVTEQAVSRDFSRMMDILSRLRIKGFPLALDDFGTGHSSLVQLYHLPFTDIKVDKSFTLDLGHEEQADTIVRAVINLAHSLQLKVCAEGVETLQTLNQLKAYGCDKVQGYYFSRPVPPDQFAALARDWNPPAQLHSIAG